MERFPLPAMIVASATANSTEPGRLAFRSGARSGGRPHREKRKDVLAGRRACPRKFVGREPAVGGTRRPRRIDRRFRTSRRNGNERSAAMEAGAKTMPRAP